MTPVDTQHTIFCFILSPTMLHRFCLLVVVFCDCNMHLLSTGVQLPLFHMFVQLLYICSHFRSRNLVLLYWPGAGIFLSCSPFVVKFHICIFSYAQISVSNLFEVDRCITILELLVTILTTCQGQSSHQCPDFSTSLL